MPCPSQFIGSGYNQGLFEYQRSLAIMSDDEQKNTDNIRRVGRKDRKKEIKAKGSLFPEESELPITPPSEALPIKPDIVDDSDIEEHLESDDNPEPTDFELDPDVLAKVLNTVNVPPLEELPRTDTDNPPIFSPVKERFPTVDFNQEDEPLPSTSVSVHDVHAESTSQPRRRFRRYYGDWRHNLIALFFMIATIGVCAFYVHIYQDPYSSINPFAPETPFVFVTETPDPAEVAQFNLSQTALYQPTNTPSSGNPTATPSPTLDAPPPTLTFAVDVFPFSLAGDVIYTPNANDEGCDWSSIAGVVTDVGGVPLNNFGIQITNTEAVSAEPERVFSGAALAFGDGGFELFLGATPTQNRYDVQLFSPAGVAVSDVYSIITSTECEQNVAIINFQQTRPF